MANVNAIAALLDFGVEIETHLPNTDPTPVGGYHAGVQCSWLPQGWKCERDGSISLPNQYTRKACEFISPKLRGSSGIAQVVEAVKNDQVARGPSQHQLRRARDGQLQR